MSASRDTVALQHIPEAVNGASADELYDVEPNGYRIVRMNASSTGYMPMDNGSGGVVYNNSIRGAWEWWKVILMPETLGDFNLFRRQHTLEREYMILAEEEIENAPMKGSNGEVVVLAREPSHVKLCLENPTLRTLNEMKRSILLSLNADDKLMDLLRLSTTLKEQTYGTMYGGTLRTPELDEAIMRAIGSFVREAERRAEGLPPAEMEVDIDMDLPLPLIRHANVGAVVNRLMNEIYLAFANSPILYVAKSYRYHLRGAPSFSKSVVLFPRPGEGRVMAPPLSSWNESLARPLPSEYKNLQYVSALTLRLGIPFVPAPYALRRVKGEPVKVPPGLTIGNVKKSEILADTPSLGDDVDVLYMQYLEGPSLLLPTLSPRLRDAAIGYLHHVLAYLVKQCNFSHGDLSHSRIILWGYNPKGNQMYELPLIDEYGQLIEYIALPFRPMLTGLDRSSTDRFSQYTETTSTHPGELSDIIRLYTADKWSDSLLGYKYILPRLIPYYQEFASGESLNGASLPPYGWAIPDVTHKELAAFHRENGVFERYKTNDGGRKIAPTVELNFGQLQVPQYSLNFIPESSIASERLSEMAQELLESVPSSALINDNLILVAIRKYLKETAQHYAV